jgi:hypothetical protein
MAILKSRSKRIASAAYLSRLAMIAVYFVKLLINGQLLNIVVRHHE